MKKTCTDAYKVFCPECGAKMELYGIFESGEYKFYCNACYRMLTNVESYNEQNG